MNNYGLGWKPQLPDHRDLKLAVPKLAQLYGLYPRRVSLRSAMPPVYDQGQLGSCTGNAIGAGYQYQQLRETLPNVTTPSRNFIYYNERVMEGTVDQDAGAELRDGLKSVATQGVCSENTWPYDIANFTAKPSDQAYAEASKHLAVRYYTMNVSVGSIKWCLGNKYPIMFGFTVYDSFFNIGSDGIMPDASGSVAGGHAVIAVGYDDYKRRVEVRNSWGDSWGDKGYFWMPYSYITNPDLCSDFWTIRSDT